MRSFRVACVAMAAVIVGCGTSVSPTPGTGLTGVVVRGPITPVCQVAVPCEAPFSAGFTVEQDGRRVAQFHSNADGRFSVRLLPGQYRVAPDLDAPIIRPASQVKTVDVGDSGMTEVRLQFDTGIR